MLDVLLSEIENAFPGGELSDDWPALKVAGEGSLPSWFAVSDLAAASVGMAGRALSALTNKQPPVRVDRRLASFWFDKSLRPDDWTVPPIWGPVAGDFQTSDGWIRLHTNAPHHQKVALEVLGVGIDRDAVIEAVATWRGQALETAIVEAGGCAAEMRDLDRWQTHAQGKAVALEPLLDWHQHGEVAPTGKERYLHRPLAGLRVLDCTRVLAGPAASRFLAAFGAEILRVDPPHWEEPAAVPEMTLGKRCAGLDLRNSDDRTTFEYLLARTDIFLHGYRAGALPGLGYDRRKRQALNPQLIDVCLNAYGWTGPWADRRGFDSLVQMSSGIADYGMKMAKSERPAPLPVQALDHATGYLLATAVLHAVRHRERFGIINSARLSLARTAHLLIKTKNTQFDCALSPETPDDLDPIIEATSWGPAQRLSFPLTIDGIKPTWDYPAGNLRSVSPSWPDNS